MEKNLSTLICLLVIGVPIIKGVLRAFRKKAISYAINEISSSVALIGTMIFVFSYFNDVNSYVGNLIESIDINSIVKYLLKFALIMICFMIVHFILYSIFRLINKILLGNFLKNIEDNVPVKAILGGVLGFIKGFLTLCIIFSIVAIINKANIFNKDIQIFNKINIYKKIEQNISGLKVNEIKSGVLQDIENGRIVYYNGVTLSEGVKSDSAINEMAKEITKNDTTDLEKAKTIYEWVGSHITYDNEKASLVMSGDRKLKSGAIEAFNTRSGICFDYACLYVAMARTVGLPVRLITGEAYNGEEYINHAWNQVYIKSLGEWINVDPTFYDAGDYFNNKNFYKDHKEQSIAGQWD
ncbi:MAG: transglutaminase domain-containing protein [Clostridium sp.]|uniref:transglutaminase domain-containing protein n=1 Tax=Clostridium sp. TaxID=1506 RepID=UPI003F2FFA75